MPPSNLQGLNVVHPVQDGADSQDLLLGHAYPDLAAQLDLWTNLAFESEEPIAPRHIDHKSPQDDDEEEARSPVTQEKAVRDGHVNVVIPTDIPLNPNASSNPAPLFDLNSFLAGFGLENAHAQSTHLLHPPGTVAPSLAQLMALHPGHPPFGNPGAPHYPPINSEADKSASHARTSSIDESAARGKRARTRKASISHHESPESYLDEPGVPSSTPLSATEDKRRRNTAASARFRLKKKEREAALEGKAKELETRVTELERECEGLRRENGWLKGLVVGVTGAAQAPGPQGLTVAHPPPGLKPTSTKRRREEAEGA